MAVGISEIAGVHEAMVFDWIDIGGAAICGGCVVHRIDSVAAFARQSQHHFARRFWWDGAACKGAPFGMGEQHEVDCFTPYHARSRLVGKPRIVLETDRFVEPDWVVTGKLSNIILLITLSFTCWDANLQRKGR